MLLFLFSWLGSRAQTVLWISGSGCVNQTQEFVYAGPGTVSSWSISGSYTGATQTTNYLSVKWTNPGTVSVTCNYINSSGGYASTSPYSLTINSTTSPSVSISASSTSICSGSPVTFTAAAANAGTPSYAWYLGGSQVSGAASVSWNTSGLSNGQQVYCKITSSNNCASPSSATSNTITETVNPVTTMTVSVAQSGTACAGQNATFQVTTNPTPANITYQWYKNGSPVTGISGPPPYVYSASGVNNGDQIYCKVSTTTACYTTPINSNTVSAVVSSSTAFSVGVGPNGIYWCQGQNVTFTATANGPATGYIWYSSGSQVASGSSTYTVAASSVAQLQGISCYAQSSGGACITGSSATGYATSIPFTVNPVVTPSVSIIASPAGTVCSGNTATFTATPVNGGSTPSYQWYLNSTAVGTNSATYANASLTNGQQVHCVMTSTAACPTPTTATSNTLTETVNPFTTMTATVIQNGTGCSGGTSTFEVNTTPSTPANISYQWYKNGSPVTGISGPPPYVYSATGINNGDQIYCVVSTTTACYATPITSNTVTATVTPSQPFTVSLGTDGIYWCQGQTVTLTVNTSAPATGYIWYANGSEVASGVTTLNVTASSAAQLEGYSVYAQVNGGTCVTGSSATGYATNIPFTVNPVVTPSVSLSANPSGIACSGSTVTITATPVNGGSSPGYQWYLDGNSVSGVSGNTYSSTSFATGDQVYCVLTSSAACPSVSTATSPTLTETVNPYVNNLAVSIAEVDQPCAGVSSASYLATVKPSQPGDAVFTWYDNGVQATNTAGVPAGLFVSNTLNPGDPIYCTMTTQTACWTPNSATSNTVATVFQTKQPFNVGIGPIGQGVEICPGHSVTLVCQTTAPALAGSYAWTVGNQPVTNNNTSTLTVVAESVAQMSNISVSVQAVQGGCLSNFSGTATTAPLPWFVTPYSIPSVSISEASVLVNGQPQVVFTASEVNGGSEPSYAWTLNGAAVGNGTTTYNAGALPHGTSNQVLLTMTASPEVCASPVTVCQNINFIW